MKHLCETMRHETPCITTDPSLNNYNTRMKKQATKQDVFVGSALASGGAGYGSVMLKTQDVDTLQSGTGRNEVLNSSRLAVRASKNRET